MHDSKLHNERASHAPVKRGRGRPATGQYPKPILAVRIPRPLQVEIRAEAERRDVSIGGFVRDALIAFLKDSPEAA